MTTFKQAFDANPATNLLDTDIIGMSRSPHAGVTDAAGMDGAALKEVIRDLIAGFIVQGANITVTHNDLVDTLTIAFSGVSADSVDNTMLANMAQATVKGRPAAAGTGDPQDLTQAQITTLVNTFTSALSGAVPAASGRANTANHALLGSGSFGQIIKTGTATLVMKGSTTQGTHAGDSEAWARVGPVVVQGFDVTWNPVDGTGNIFMDGLPYPSNGAFQCIFLNAFGITVSHSGTTARVLNGNSQIDFQKIAPGTGLISNYTDSDCPLDGSSNKRIRAIGTLVYTTSAAF